MNRRTILSLLTTGTITTAGCTSGISLKKGENSTGNRKTDPKKSEKCGNYIIHTHSLPGSAKDEVIAAIEDDHYETEEELLLPEVVDVNESYLLHREGGERVYYKMSVETDGEATSLRAGETLPEPDAVWVENTTEKGLTVDIHIEHEGDLLVERTVDIGAHEDVELNENTEYEYGNYRVEVKVHNETKFEDTELTWEVHSYKRVSPSVQTESVGCYPHMSVGPVNGTVMVNSSAALRPHNIAWLSGSSRRIAAQRAVRTPWNFRLTYS